MEAPVRAVAVPECPPAPQSSAVSQKFHSAIAIAASVLLLPQLPLLFCWTLAPSGFRFRGLIDTEFLLLFAVALVRPSLFLLLALVLDLLLDLLNSLSFLYYLQPWDALRSLRYIVLFPPRRLAAYLALLLLYTAVCAAVLRVALKPAFRLKQRRRTSLLLLAVLLAAVGMDLPRGRFFVLPARNGETEERRLPWLTRVPALSLAHNFIGHALAMTTQEGPALPSTLERALARLPPGSRPDVVLVLTESWGMANDLRIDRAELAPYLDPRLLHRYKFETGASPFLGSTTSGETRELCGESGGRWDAVPFSACRPAQLASKGYRTLAVHGFTPAIFDRAVWYRQFGFQRSVFLSELRRDGVPQCGGALPGACDAGVAHWLAGELTDGRNQRPVFVHWVTLNSHLPVPDTPAESAGEDCRPVGLAEDRGLCSWFRLVQRVHRGVASLALAPNLRPTVFVIVGDHAPPFLRENARDRFSQTEVPYVILTPRALDTPAALIRLQASTTRHKKRPAAKHSLKEGAYLREPSESAATSDTR